MDIERRFWEAAGDPDFYERHLASEATMAFHIGVMSRDEVVASPKGAPSGGASRSTIHAA